MILAIPVYTILRVIGAEFFSQFEVVRTITENMNAGIDEEEEESIEASDS